MYFFKLVVVATCSLPCLVWGIPTLEPSDLVILEQFTKDAGAGPVSITVYGDASRPSQGSEEVANRAGPDLDRRCGSNQVTCDNSNGANRDACVNLVNAFRGDQAQLPGSPRSICATYSGAKCCVSWHNPVSGAVRAHLVDAASKSLNTCGTNPISAKASNVLIGQTCTDQCLSNRATNC